MNLIATMLDPGASEIIFAQMIPGPIRLDAAHPAAAWQSAAPICFNRDWQEENADPAIETEVRVLCNGATLYVRFTCHYRELCVFKDSDSTGRRDQLWDRDVAEAFLQPHPSSAGYKEFEIAPNGMWIDLDIAASGGVDLKSGLSRSVHLNAPNKIWVAELAIPMQSLTSNFDPSREWRANFYRVEGKSEPRRYMAWRPTGTPQPNFHVPERFGRLQFRRG